MPKSNVLGRPCSRQWTILRLDTGGFSLVELMVVMAMMLLMAGGLTQYMVGMKTQVQGLEFGADRALLVGQIQSGFAATGGCSNVLAEGKVVDQLGAKTTVIEASGGQPRTVVRTYQSGGKTQTVELFKILPESDRNKPGVYVDKVTLNWNAPEDSGANIQVYRGNLIAHIEKRQLVDGKIQTVGTPYAAAMPMQFRYDTTKKQIEGCESQSTPSQQLCADLGGSYNESADPKCVFTKMLAVVPSHAEYPNQTASSGSGGQHGGRGSHFSSKLVLLDGNLRTDLLSTGVTVTGGGTSTTVQRQGLLLTPDGKTSLRTHTAGFLGLEATGGSGQLKQTTIVAGPMRPDLSTPSPYEEALRYGNFTGGSPVLRVWGDTREVDSYWLKNPDAYLTTLPLLTIEDELSASFTVLESGRVRSTSSALTVAFQRRPYDGKTDHPLTKKKQNPMVPSLILGTGKADIGARITTSEDQTALRLEGGVPHASSRGKCSGGDDCTKDLTGIEVGQKRISLVAAAQSTKPGEGGGVHFVLNDSSSSFVKSAELSLRFSGWNDGEIYGWAEQVVFESSKLGITQKSKDNELTMDATGLKFISPKFEGKKTTYPLMANCETRAITKAQGAIVPPPVPIGINCQLAGKKGQYKAIAAGGYCDTPTGGDTPLSIDFRTSDHTFSGRCAPPLALNTTIRAWVTCCVALENFD